MEETLAGLTVYPEPSNLGGTSTTDTTSTTEGGNEQESAIGDAAADPATASKDQASGPLSRPQATAAAIGEGIQEKTDEVLKSITTSFATVTDLFGGAPSGGSAARKDSKSDGAEDGEGGAGAGAQRQGGGSPMKDRFGGSANEGGGGAGGGWDLFKPPSMAEMKRRLEDMTSGTASSSLSPPKAPARASVFMQKRQPAAAAAATTPTGLSVRQGRAGAGESTSLSPVRSKDPGGAAAAGLAKFGEGWRDFRRRSTEAVEEAVTKLKTALDDSDDEGAADVRVAERIAANASARAEKAKAEGKPTAKAEPGEDEDDAFWKPFGEGAAGCEGEPVPLPTAEEVRRGRAAGGGRSAAAARTDLDSYYGGGGGSGRG